MTEPVNATSDAKVGYAAQIDILRAFWGDHPEERPLNWELILKTYPYSPDPEYP